jgi:hypothetical protein
MCLLTLDATFYRITKRQRPSEIFMGVGGKGDLMPMHRLLQNIAFEPPQIAVMTTVFDSVCLDLGLTDGNPQREAIAKAIIDCAQTGEFDPIKLRVAALGATKP